MNDSSRPDGRMPPRPPSTDSPAAPEQEAIILTLPMDRRPLTDDAARGILDGATPPVGHLADLVLVLGSLREPGSTGELRGQERAVEAYRTWNTGPIPIGVVHADQPDRSGQVGPLDGLAEFSQVREPSAAARLFAAPLRPRGAGRRVAPGRSRSALGPVLAVAGCAAAVAVAIAIPAQNWREVVVSASPSAPSVASPWSPGSTATQAPDEGAGAATAAGPGSAQETPHKHGVGRIPTQSGGAAATPVVPSQTSPRASSAPEVHSEGASSAGAGGNPISPASPVNSANSHPNLRDTASSLPGGTSSEPTVLNGGSATGLPDRPKATGLASAPAGPANDSVGLPGVNPVPSAIAAPTTAGAVPSASATPPTDSSSAADATPTTTAPSSRGSSQRRSPAVRSSVAQSAPRNGLVARCDAWRRLRASTAAEGSKGYRGFDDLLVGRDPEAVDVTCADVRTSDD